MMKAMLILTFFVSIPLLADETSLQYKATGSTPLSYRAFFYSREETTPLVGTATAKVSRRRLELSKKIRLQPDPLHPGELSTQVGSIIQAEEGDLSPLTSELKAEYPQQTTGLSNELFSVEAIPYLGIPLPVGIEEATWQAVWKIRLEDGAEQPMSGSYQIKRIGLLAGRTCSFISYRLASLDLPTSFGEAPHDRWEGEGQFTFDIVEGTVVAHRGTLVRSGETLSGSAKKVTRYEIAEVLIP